MSHVAPESSQQKGKPPLHQSYGPPPGAVAVNLIRGRVHRRILLIAPDSKSPGSIPGLPWFAVMFCGRLTMQGKDMVGAERIVKYDYRKNPDHSVFVTPSLRNSSY